LNFENIRLRNGRSYAFTGLLENVISANGESARVDTEGTVQEGDNRTNTTLGRTAIGTAIGAIIGAVAGGGSGAAIGAAVGAGAGAGSVYVQGRDDLNLTRGTEVTIRASAPGYVR
jgi:outer membrane lipoprotein SlyB